MYYAGRQCIYSVGIMWAVCVLQDEKKDEGKSEKPASGDDKKAEGKKATEEKKPKEPSFEMLSNPTRVMKQQLKVPLLTIYYPN